VQFFPNHITDQTKSAQGDANSNDNGGDYDNVADNIAIA
jgi:hypothetical protein